ncbi:pleckstrin homology domain-containing family G member 7-like [Lytechinus variegatus]|uniref:pleckstrin homology domain-containing family G member 7-like n=1 Tax=Lytechinus variegatus TaxID=7654 RepID=UPI001BB0F3DA|nr:pleckstrin homology domain-containing family G member 7-like [Lytechinus variegatus]
MEIISHNLPGTSSQRMTMDDIVICRSVTSPRSLNSANSFDNQYCNTSYSETNTTSSAPVRRTETKCNDGLFRGRYSKLNRRNIIMKNQQPLRSSSFDTEWGPSSHPQSYRIKSRRGAVTSDLSPASSETSVEEIHDRNDSPWKLAETTKTPHSAPCSPQLQLKPSRPNSMYEADINQPISEVGPTLASVAAVHLQDFIEASAQGLNRHASEQDKKRKLGTLFRKSISAKIKRTLGRQDSFTADNITSLFSKFKIHDKDELEFAVYKDKDWRSFMEWSLGQSDHINQEPLSKEEIKRRDKVWELFKSECIYLVDHILVLKEIFQERLRWLQCEGHLMHIEMAKLFANLDELCAVSTEFCRELFRNFTCDEGTTQFAGTHAVVAAFTNFSNQLCPAYSRYCMNYSGALHYLQFLREQEDFLEFIKLCEQDKRCKRLKLVDLLITPIQRITKYSLLLRDIRDCISDALEQAQIDVTLQNVERSLDELEGKVKWLSSFERLREIQQMLTWPADQDGPESSRVCPECRHSSDDESTDNSLLVSSQRTLIHEGSLRMIDHDKHIDVYAFLFDDMLLITRKRRKLVTRRSFTGCPGNIPDQRYQSPPRIRDGITFVVCKAPIMLDQLHQIDVYPENETSAHDVKHRMVLVKTDRDGHVPETYTFDCTTEQVKQTWILHLQQSRKKWEKRYGKE